MSLHHGINMLFVVAMFLHFTETLRISCVPVQENVTAIINAEVSNELYNSSTFFYFIQFKRNNFSIAACLKLAEDCQITGEDFVKNITKINAYNMIVIELEIFKHSKGANSSTDSLMGVPWIVELNTGRTPISKECYFNSYDQVKLTESASISTSQYGAGDVPSTVTVVWTFTSVGVLCVVISVTVAAVLILRNKVCDAHKKTIGVNDIMNQGMNNSETENRGDGSPYSTVEELTSTSNFNHSEEDHQIRLQRVMIADDEYTMINKQIHSTATKKAQTILKRFQVKDQEYTLIDKSGDVCEYSTANEHLSNEIDVNFHEDDSVRYVSISNALM